MLRWRYKAITRCGVKIIESLSYLSLNHFTIMPLKVMCDYYLLFFRT